MTRTMRFNGQIPTDPATLLLLAVSISYAFSQLTTEQAQALTATGGIAELALLFTHLLRERR